MKKLLSLVAIVVAITSVLFHSCRKDKDILYNNQSPVANAGIDQVTILPKDSVVLDGSASKDPDGDIAYFHWAKIAGPPFCSIIQPDRVTTVVNTLVLGIYQFELTIKDNNGAVAKDTMQVTVSTGNGTNVPPVANAGPDQVVTLPVNACTLNGSGSYDPDGTITSYHWTKVAGPLTASLANPDAATTQVFNLLNGVYQFELVVSDNNGSTGKDTVQVTVGGVGNRPPVANAGLDETITYPLNYYTLNGSASSDPGGRITMYQWSQLTGPPVHMGNTKAIQCTIRQLLEGVYTFELAVTDNDGLTAKDTIQLTVRSSADCNISNRSQINARLVQVGTLSVPRSPAIGAAGTKIVFAGGITYDDEFYGTFSDAVDIYDISRGSWTTSRLSYPRAYGAVVGCGNKIFFADGRNWEDPNNELANVDVYDASTDTWTVEHLSIYREQMAAAAVGSKVLFAGGMSDWGPASSRVDIYDINTKQWTTAELSVPRMHITAVTAGTKVYFAGGYGINNTCNTIDIYDNATGRWSTAALKELGGSITGVSVGDRIYWAGNSRLAPDGLGRVEMWNTSTGAVDLGCLAHSRVVLGANANDVVFFDNYGDPWLGSHFDLYNTVSGTWYTGVPDKWVTDPRGISFMNTIYMISNETNASKVYTLSWN